VRVGALCYGVRCTACTSRSFGYGNEPAADFQRCIVNSLRPSYSINFYLLTLLVMLFVAVEPRLVSWLRVIEPRVVSPANLFLLRPLMYACGLLLFLIFDDRDTQFIYFQF